jgi:hypothetical protein
MSHSTLLYERVSSQKQQTNLQQQESKAKDMTAAGVIAVTSHQSPVTIVSHMQKAEVQITIPLLPDDELGYSGAIKRHQSRTCCVLPLGHIAQLMD